ncbi:MAG: FecR domain-containing protein, partial [Hyphomicrobiales bacterium]|nr:FecR domain-containing protein [Hyphomicrobiales bacterium]
GALAATEIGSAAEVTKQVTGTLQASQRTLAKGDPVYQSETIATAANAEGEFVFLDQTKLAVGPKSEIILDTFVYDPSGKGGEIVINAAKGAFRFISGNSTKTAYKINTPVSTIGVRGTIFDGFVNDDGEIALLVVEGEIDVCPTPASCRRLNQRGLFYHIRRNGVISEPRKWDGTFFNGVDFGRAFPFVGKRMRIHPRPQLKRAELLDDKLQRHRIRPLRVVPRVVPRTRVKPKPRLPRVRRQIK